ncbi:MAG: hypothetical protein KF760_21160 [Candidatus Eremiobacteraeota bacterium]|nr:hypothetical protein [Candidatus Eremiobacteraeota bacterium]
MGVQSGLLENPQAVGAGTEDYIKLLQQEADFQSSGRFSLEAKKALQKMQKFRLQDPAEYILQLVSCAVMRGASLIQMEIGGRDIRVGFDGEPFTARELEDIFECASQESQQPLTASGAHLAIALQAMRTYNPDVLIVESRDRQGRNVLQLYEEEVWIETLIGASSRSKVVTYVGLEHSLNFFNMCFPSLIGMWRAEHNLLRRLACAAPIPVVVNGRKVPFVTGMNTVLLEGPGRAPLWAQDRQHVQVVKKQPCWGIGARRYSELSQLYFIQAGICFRQLGEKLPPGLVVYLQEDSLKRDLSQRELIKSQARADLIAAALKVLK